MAETLAERVRRLCTDTFPIFEPESPPPTSPIQPLDQLDQEEKKLRAILTTRQVAPGHCKHCNIPLEACDYHGVKDRE